MNDNALTARFKAHSHRACFALSLLISAAFSGLCYADAILGLNSIEQQANNTYVTNGPDSFVIFKLDASEQIRQNQGSANHISLDLSLTDPSKVSELNLEVFFKPLEQEGELRFDPLYRLRLLVPSAALEIESGKLLIAVPNELELRADQKIRIDIDNCAACSFQINGAPQLINQTKETLPSVNQVFAYRVFNGAKPLPANGVNVDTQDWHLNHILRSNNALMVDGNDPYLVSHDLDINTQDLGGVLFTLRYQKPSTAPRDYQLFYATDNHAFVEHASGAVRVKDDQDGVSRFVIPLQFLSESQPVARVLQRLRLDLLPAGDNPSSWYFNETRVLSKAQISEYANLVPARIVHNKRQRATGIQLLKNVLKKVLSDPWFVALYLLLIILTGLGFWRQFKR